jgi:hypothetical protein
MSKPAKPASDAPTRSCAAAPVEEVLVAVPVEVEVDVVVAVPVLVVVVPETETPERKRVSIKKQNSWSRFIDGQIREKGKGRGREAFLPDTEPVAAVPVPVVVARVAVPVPVAREAVATPVVGMKKELMHDCTHRLYASVSACEPEPWLQPAAQVVVWLAIASFGAGTVTHKAWH